MKCRLPKPFNRLLFEPDERVQCALQVNWVPESFSANRPPLISPAGAGQWEGSHSAIDNMQLANLVVKFIYVSNGTKLQFRG